jgi:hypothetical protein
MRSPVSRPTALIFTFVLLIGGCRSDLTGPPSTILSSSAGTRAHRATNGILFTLDHRQSTLTATGGKPVHLSREMMTRLEKDFDLMKVVEERRIHFQAQPRYRQLGKARPSASTRLIRAAVGRSTGPFAPSTRSAQLGSMAPRLSADIYDGMDESGVSCLEIAQAIYAEQPIYDHARDQLDEALFELSQAGARGEWGVEDFEAAALAEVAEWNYQAELSKMNFLAVMYNSYNCWSNDWTDASVSSGGGGGGDGSGGGGGGCHEEYGTLEISYDGGMTWEDLWSGWVSVCGEMAE